MKSPSTTDCLLRVVFVTVLLMACSPAAQPATTASSTAPPIRPTPTTVPRPNPAASQTVIVRSRCTATMDDGFSHTYKPNAPVRSVVGQGHTVTGVVRSSADCAPIPNVKLEFWSEAPGVGHPDEYRATLFTDSTGTYRFVCNPTDHIHMRISAAGYRSIASNAYHTEGRPAGIFDIVLRPEKP
jgi:protocatechuate 3,4-dioxygenase beta subunit